MSDSLSRREAVRRSAAALGLGAAALGAVPALQAEEITDALVESAGTAPQAAPGRPGVDYTPVRVPNGDTLPFTIVDGVKVFHLVAEPITHEFAPGLTVPAWGYNGRSPGPVLEAVEGDRVRIYVSNRLPNATSVHWHGIILPSGMDGVAGLSQQPIPPNSTFKYEFTLRQHGTFMYHTHYDEMIQQAMGLMGMIVVHPRVAPAARPDRDFVVQMAEWRVPIGATRIDPLEMTDFNVLTFNGKCFPSTEALPIQLGDRVRIRFGNLSAMSHHTIHVHGLAWRVTATDGGTIAPAGQWPESSTFVPVGTTRTVEFTATNPGDWAMHCHMTHHTMTQMGHAGVNPVGVDAAALDRLVQPLLPSYMTMGQTGMSEMSSMRMPTPEGSTPMLGGPGPKGHIDMGGMFTVLKVRDRLPAKGEVGWYDNPPGTEAREATPAELARDGVTLPPPAGGAAAPHRHHGG